MADVSLFGLWAGGHHIGNVLLHAVNAVLVLALGRQLGLGPPAALVVAAVFAVHPAQVESVAWVSERKTVLSMCFMLLSLLAYLRWQAASRGRHALGWPVIGGMLAATFLSIFLIPACFYLVEKYFVGPKHDPAQPPPAKD
jgi:hypothetical protein